jgi:hypothetical protein
MVENKDTLKRKKIEAYLFLDKHMDDIEEYFGENPGIIYGIDGNIVARWVGGTLAGRGYDEVLYFDVNIKSLSEMSHEYLRKQVEGRKVLLLKDGVFGDDILFFVSKIKKSGANVVDLQVITTNPYRWYPQKELEALLPES